VGNSCTIRVLIRSGASFFDVVLVPTVAYSVLDGVNEDYFYAGIFLANYGRYSLHALSTFFFVEMKLLGAGLNTVGASLFSVDAGVGFIYSELAFVTTREALYCVGGGGISISVVRLFTRLFFFEVVVVCFSPVLVSFYAAWGSFNIVVVSFFLVLDTFRGGVVFF